MDGEELELYIKMFDPYRDRAEWKEEKSDAYADRMQSTLLPHWPKEVLIEWLYRHSPHIADYAPLLFEDFRFSLQRWKLADIPGRDAYLNRRLCDDFSNIESRASGPYGGDWLAKYMLSEGTWNTPIILLDNHDGMATHKAWGEIRSPWHLLEGHRRLAFLNGLRELGRGAQEHDIYVVNLVS